MKQGNSEKWKPTNGNYENRNLEKDNVKQDTSGKGQFLTGKSTKEQIEKETHEKQFWEIK